MKISRQPIQCKLTVLDELHKSFGWTHSPVRYRLRAVLVVEHGHGLLVALLALIVTDAEIDLLFVFLE